MKQLYFLPRRLLSAGILLLFLACLSAAVKSTVGRVPETDAASEEEQQETQDVCHIRMTYPIVEGVSVVTDLEEIEEAVNQISIKEIGVEVELIPEDMSDAVEDYVLWLSRGDTLDLMLVRNQDIRPYIDKGLLTSLSGYLERNADAILKKDLLLDGRITGGAKQQGKVYGVSNISGQETISYGLWISAEVLSQTDVAYDENHIYSMEEIERLLGELKSLYPDSYPLGQITAKQINSSAVYYMDPGNALGGDLLTGVIGQESDTVENFFASEEYQEFLSYMERWYQFGFVYPDSVIYDASVLKLLEDQTILMFPGSAYPGTMDLMTGRETDYVCLRMTQPRKKGNGDWDFWTVPSTSRYPREAVKFLDLLYRDNRIAYLLNYGISQEHYVIADTGEKLLVPVTDAGGKISGFYNPFAGIGDTRDLYVYGTPQQQVQRERYEELAEEKQKDPYEEFIYSTAGVSRQVDAVRKVINVYLPVLESGSADLQKNYPEFLKDLEEAGINEIIADKQEQFDAWKKQNLLTEQE